MPIINIDVPEGVSGAWKIERFEIDKMNASMSLFSYGARVATPGLYTRLTHNSSVVMSDTPAEVSDHIWLNGQRGVGLMNGLGLGVGIELSMKRADFLYVVENSKDVINLSAPHYMDKYGDRVEFIYADALTYMPPKGMRFDFVWHDIWPDICSDNHKEMMLLKRRYGRLCGGNQKCWSEDLL